MTLSNNQPAFPVVAHHEVYSTGMDLRDWFAGMALQGFISSNKQNSVNDINAFVIHAYLYADKMMEARNAKD